MYLKWFSGSGHSPNACGILSELALSILQLAAEGFHASPHTQSKFTQRDQAVTLAFTAVLKYSLRCVPAFTITLIMTCAILDLSFSLLGVSL